MCLGSIAHLQYYFARTGLLDGKGGQMAKTKQNGEYDIPRLSLSGNETVESPIEEEGQLLWEAAKEDGDAVMLPPTVSTYSHRDNYIPPPPDQKSLKQDLVESLEVALHAIEDTVPSKNSVPREPEEEEPTQGFYEIRGLHVLDATTLAIRAARLYYTMHPNPTRLNSIRSDYQLRRDLMAVLDVLKRWAGRKFAGGLREEERLAILVWVSEVGMMIDQETKLEDAERQEREGWSWMDHAAWVGKDELRELSFLSSLLDSAVGHKEPLPQWVPSSHDQAQTAFLRSLADGRQLIRMHNAAVKRSKKEFGQITSHHADVAKPYRRADNLRFWVKAAEIRWDVKLTLSVVGVVNSSQDPQVWKAFEDAVFGWSRAAREEVTRDWKTDEERKLHARARSLALASPAHSPKKKSAEFGPESPIAV